MPTVGSPYSEQLTASGGSGSGYTFAATGLPAGLSMSPSGLLSGSPTSTAPYTMVVTVTDSDNATGSQTYAGTVDPALVLSPSTLPVPTVGSPYSEQLTASGGSGTGFTFAATGLPAGLSMSSSGLLSGTPSSTAPYTMVVTVTDSDNATGTHTYTLTVDPALVLSPTTLPTPTAGNFYSEQLTASGGSGSGYVFSSGDSPTRSHAQ